MGHGFAACKRSFPAAGACSELFDLRDYRSMRLSASYRQFTANPLVRLLLQAQDEFYSGFGGEMKQTISKVPAHATEPDTRAGATPREDRGSAVESDPVAIIAGLRGEMSRVCLTDDSSCICIISPDGAADAMLMGALGEWITSSLRSNDALYRIADDKYLIVLRQIDRDAAVGYLKRLRERVLAESVPATGGDDRINVTASFGGTMMDARAPLYEHMDRASEAHSWALKGMGDTICMWTPRF